MIDFNEYPIKDTKQAYDIMCKYMSELYDEMYDKRTDLPQDDESKTMRLIGYTRSINSASQWILDNN